jgi:hypothetical protein
MWCQKGDVLLLLKVSNTTQFPKGYPTLSRIRMNTEEVVINLIHSNTSITAVSEFHHHQEHQAVHLRFKTVVVLLTPLLKKEHSGEQYAPPHFQGFDREVEGLKMWEGRIKEKKKGGVDFFLQYDIMELVRNEQNKLLPKN